jgi:hypothetical protein
MDVIGQTPQSNQNSLKRLGESKGVAYPNPPLHPMLAIAIAKQLEQVALIHLRIDIP